ncbi:MAG: hypothetical protein ACO1OB_07875 [Archangium sp.]
MTNKLIALMLVVSSVAFAQKSEPTKQSKPKTQVIEFNDGLSVDGDTLLPMHTYIEARNPPRFDCLIKVRGNFNDKLAASVYEM